jgi:mannitol/fructose-specific phosphotransferase system IIA component (Ntr-type)
LAVSPTAVYYALTEVPITIVALMLSPASAGGSHLNYLSSLSMLLHSDATRRELQAIASPEELSDYLSSHARLR